MVYLNISKIIRQSGRYLNYYLYVRSLLRFVTIYDTEPCIQAANSIVSLRLFQASAIHVVVKRIKRNGETSL
jgi:hypothetical protein